MLCLDAEGAEDSSGQMNLQWTSWKVEGSGTVSTDPKRVKQKIPNVN